MPLHWLRVGVSQAPSLGIRDLNLSRFGTAATKHLGNVSG